MKIDKQLIVVADDFGLTESVNDGIVQAYKHGIVSEISLMLDFPATRHALTLIRDHSLKNVGIHLLLQGYDKEHKMLRRDDYISLFKEKSYEEIKDMACYELDKFVKTVGSIPTHIIPQYGIHGNLKLLDFLIEYARDNKIPMRIPRSALSNSFGENYAAEIMMRRSKIQTTDYLIVETDGFDLQQIQESIIQQLKNVKKGETVEIVTHPAYFDKELLIMSSLNFERARDLTMTLDPSFKKEIINLGFEIVSYSKMAS